jgi:hypothetical protein
VTNNLYLTGRLKLYCKDQRQRRYFCIIQFVYMNEICEYLSSFVKKFVTHFIGERLKTEKGKGKKATKIVKGVIM